MHHNDARSPAANLLKIKLLLNSTTSDADKRDIFCDSRYQRLFSSYINKESRVHSGKVSSHTGRY